MVKWFFNIWIIWIIFVRLVFVYVCFKIINKIKEMINVGIVDYIKFFICLNKFVLIIVVVKFVDFDKGDILLLKIELEIIVFIIKVGFNFKVLLILKKVILIVDIIVKVLFIVLLIIV